MIAPKKRIIVIAALVLAAIVAMCFESVTEYLKDKNILKPDPKGDYLAVLSVGEADAVLVHSGGETALIDTGNIFDVGNALASKLKRANIKRIDTLILTHNHQDHSGGLYSVLTQFEVDCFYYQTLFNDTEKSDDYFKNIRKIVREKEVNTGIIKENMTFEIGKFDFCVLASGQSGTVGDKENDKSVVLQAKCQGKNFLLMSDAGEHTERYILQKYGEQKCDVLKVGHHGSDSATSEVFVKKVKPNYAAISCGAGNTYGHPSERTLKILDKYNVNVLRTDIHSDIYFYIENNNLTVKTAQ